MSGPVGFVSVGLMGYGMYPWLLETGYERVVMAHRRRDRADDLIERGARRLSIGSRRWIRC